MPRELEDKTGHRGIRVFVQFATYPAIKIVSQKLSHENDRSCFLFLFFFLLNIVANVLLHIV